jgi:thiamine kinase-like enzyme
MSTATRAVCDTAVRNFGYLVKQLASPPVTVVHGDFRLDNMFKEESFWRVIDWQFVARARAAYDVAYFLGLNVSPSLLHEHKAEFLQLYHEKLREAGVQYTFEELRRDYSASLQVTAAVFIMGAASTDLNVRMQEVIFQTLPVHFGV